MGAFTYGALVHILAQLERAAFWTGELKFRHICVVLVDVELHTRGLPWGIPTQIRCMVH